MRGIQHVHLNKAAREIWKLCKERDIFIFAFHTSSKKNFEADLESRKLLSETEYELADFTSRKITKQF